MKFDYTQIFLLIWIVAFWIYYFSTYGKVEEKHEHSVREKYGTHAKWGPFFGSAFMGWTAVIFIYFFHYDSRAWVWRLSLPDCAAVKIAAVMILCFAFLLNILFTISVGKSIRTAFTANQNPPLITTGVYGRIRHPAYLAFFAVAGGTFLIISNLITLLLLVYTWVVIYGHTLEEEKKMTMIYGEAYERYRRSTGRFLPKLKI
ncbi:MAG: isoprenylcysteine carboxylmethyltransferase family protein [Desulfobacteraceae bacterium]|nr:MAG: isoprenylcysteine carboxylmethyltransferase family protein [Desulfobacteraceae bacterium]